MVEQLTDRDLAAVRHDSGQAALHAVVETELAFANQLKDDGRRVGLGQACDLEMVPAAIGVL